MKKAILVLFSISLISFFGCGKNPQSAPTQPTIEVQAKAEMGRIFAAINDGKFLTYIYNSTIAEDHDFFNQYVNVAARNIDYDIYCQTMIVIKSFSKVLEINAENVADCEILASETEKLNDGNTELLQEIHQNKVDSIMLISQLIAALADINFEDLHRYNAFEIILSKIDEPMSKIYKSWIGVKSEEDFTYTKIDENTVKVMPQSNFTFQEGLILKLVNGKWEFYEVNGEKISFDFTIEEKELLFQDIGETFYFDTSTPEAQIEKAQKIHMLTMFNESLVPLMGNIDQESFEISFMLLLEAIEGQIPAK